MKEICILPPGAYRRKVKRFVVQIQATVTVDWPEGVPVDEETVIDRACGIIPQNDSVDVGDRGIVWADRHAECSTDDAEIIERIDIKEQP